MAQKKVLMTAANGMKVWVPVDRLESWKAAQADRSPKSKKENRMLAERLVSRLYQQTKAPGTSE